MRRRLWGIVYGLIALPLGVEAAPLPLPTARDLLYPNRIRVRLVEAAPKVEISGSRLKLSEPGKPVRLLDSASDGSPSQWVFRCQDGRVRAVPVLGGQAIDLPDPVSVQATGAFVYFRGKPYREELQIHSVGSFCEVVNSVEVERYLVGVVNSEFNSKWNEDAIGAQIVAARTYALYQIKIARGEPERRYDVDASVSDQVYDGPLREDLRAQRLVEKTRGMVLTVGNDWHPSPLKAYYHSTCGGMTELPENVWGNPSVGFRRPVKCPFCGGSPALNWQLELTSKDMLEAFRRAAVSSEGTRPDWAQSWPEEWRQIVGTKLLKGMRVGAVDGEGRVSEMVTSWGYLDPRTRRLATIDLKLAGARFREWLGPARLRSTSFRVLTQVFAHGQGSWRILGRGNGHGVGMCQWGAKTMGERGYKTASILKHYYPDAILRKLW
jgi:stage II sporulation protein D